jgi:hypothetical protein
MVMVVRRGRKRKIGQRHPNGELVAERRDDRALAALQPHRRWLPPDQRLSEKAGTPLGGLNLIGILSDAQFEAGLRYAVVVGEYRAVIEPPRGLSGGGKGFACAGDCVRRRRAGDSVDCACEKRKQRYDAAFAAVITAGQRAARAVARVAIHAEACPTGALADLKRGLDALCRHFGLAR